jgi:hypothetical protein
MKLYIKIDENGDIASYPITQENLNHFFGSGVQWDDEIALTQGFAAIKNYQMPPYEEYSEVTKGEIIKNAQGEIEQLWSVTEISREEKIRRWILGPREYYLISSDWTQLADAPISAEERALWATYRAALRDITDTADIDSLKSRIDVLWPQPPTQLSKDSKYGIAPPLPPRLDPLALIVPPEPT